MKTRDIRCQRSTSCCWFFLLKKKKIFLLPSVVYSQTKITAPSIFHIAGWRLTKTNNILAWSSLYTGCWLSSWPRNTLFLQTTLRCFSVLFSTLASDLESKVTRLGHILVYAFRRAHRWPKGHCEGKLCKSVSRLWATRLWRSCKDTMSDRELIIANSVVVVVSRYRRSSLYPAAEQSGAGHRG